MNSFQAVKLMFNKIVCILNVDLAYFDYVHVHTSYKQDEVGYNSDFYNSDLIFLNLGENKVSF